MSVKLLALAAEIVDTNPAGSQLIVNITKAETGAELIEALDNYDATVIENYQSDEDVVEVENEAIVRSVQPDFARLKQCQARGVMVTSRSDTPGYDFVSRFFAPRVGVNEDPVTGSAHCALVPYWSQKLGKTELMAYQASARGGELRLRLEGERVIIAGQAVTILKAELAA